MRKLSRPSLVFPLLLFASVHQADVRLPSIFGDHMVLQRESTAPIWGWADPGEEVAVRADWLDEAQVVQADDSGAWRVDLTTPEAGGPHALRISAGNELVIQDVLMGEVWICSGQSNMEWSLAASRPGYEAFADRDMSTIRLFDVTRAVSPTPEKDCEGSWSVCTADTATRFSAVGLFFGNELNVELGVPIGLVGTNWGGTVAEAWTSEGTLSGMDDFASGLAEVAALRKDLGTVEAAHRDALASWWQDLNKNGPGGAEDWKSPGFEDGSWKTAELPGKWEDTGLGNFDGIVWYRRTIEIPAEWAGQDLTLELGPIDDMDTTWFNGVRVGGLEEEGKWTTPRVYSVPADAVHAGANTIAVRVLDTGGAGGLQGAKDQLRIAPDEPADAQSALSLSGTWRYSAGLPLAEMSPWPRTRRLHQNSPTALFNGMLSPLIPYGIRGAIWYQGESNLSRAHQYRRLFPAMIGDWRRHWSRGNFPFYFVQIAPFRYGNDRGQAAELREAQFLTLTTPNTGMAVTMDVGNPRDIHPVDKRTVGQRLALWALSQTYGRDGVVYSGPLYRAAETEGGSIRLHFDHVGGGLVAKDGELTHFQIAGEDQRFVPAKAVIDGETIVVTSAEVAEPAAVRYAWGDADEPNLFNAAGLPASSFRTDDWPAVTAGR